MSTYLSDYDYFLPEELIGQKPREPRDRIGCGLPL